MDCSHICILGVHHSYQLDVLHKEYLQTIGDLTQMHKVDLIAEEASSQDTFAKRWVQVSNEQLKTDFNWRGVDLNGEDRKGIPDNNPLGCGTLQDLEFQNIREFCWIARTLSTMKKSALVICGWAHTLSLADKFNQLGFSVEVNLLGLPKDVENLLKTPRC